MNESEFIEKIIEVDAAIKENARRIESIATDESNLQSTLKLAKEKETIATGRYSESPTEENQATLEKAREFTQSSQRRVNLYKNTSGPFENDNKTLWARRKSLVNDLSKMRITDTREALEQERETLLKTLYPQVERLMILTAHLDGLSILSLDFNRMMQKHNINFKQDLENAHKEMKTEFEKVYAD